MRYGDQTRTLPLIVVSGDGPALFGRDWLREIRLDWGSIQNLSAPLEDILEKYAEVFRPELGELQGIMEVKPGARHRFFKP